jgi:hypothetical protein
MAAMARWISLSPGMELIGWNEEKAEPWPYPQGIRDRDNGPSGGYYLLATQERISSPYKPVDGVSVSLLSLSQNF